MVWSDIMKFYFGRLVHMNSTLFVFLAPPVFYESFFFYLQIDKSVSNMEVYVFIAYSGNTNLKRKDLDKKALLYTLFKNKVILLDYRTHLHNDICCSVKINLEIEWCLVKDSYVLLHDSGCQCWISTIDLSCQNWIYQDI